MSGTQTKFLDLSWHWRHNFLNCLYAEPHIIIKDHTNTLLLINLEYDRHGDTKPSHIKAMKSWLIN